MNYSTEENIKGQLGISIILGLPQPLTVMCVSASREGTSFEILDQDQISMGVQTFHYANASGEFHLRLVEELNVLLEEWDIQIGEKDFHQVSKLAVSKCESLYGNGIEGGDCVITIQ